VVYLRLYLRLLFFGLYFFRRELARFNARFVFLIIRIVRLVTRNAVLQALPVNFAILAQVLRSIMNRSFLRLF
jgi:hypothetical protein